MWVKLLQDIHYEGGRIVPAGSVVWLRRAGKIVDEMFRQDYSVMTLETEDEHLLVLPDAEGTLWEQTEEPK